MNENTTKNLDEKSSIENLILAKLNEMQVEMDARFSAVDARFDELKTDLHGAKLVINDINHRVITLEETIERRLYDTRPMWEGVQVQLTNVQEQMTTMQQQIATVDEKVVTVQATVKQMDTKLGVLNNTILDLRADHLMLEKRVTKMDNAEIQ